MTQVINSAYTLGIQYAEAIHTSDVMGKSIVKTATKVLREDVTDFLLHCEGDIERHNMAIPVDSTMFVQGAYRFATDHKLGKSDASVTKPKQAILMAIRAVAKSHDMKASVKWDTSDVDNINGVIDFESVADPDHEAMLAKLVETAIAYASKHDLDIDRELARQGIDIVE